MSTYNTVATLDGLFKDTYADSITDLVPETAKITKMVKFISKDKQNGKFFNVPVIVSYEQGFSYSTASATFNVETPVSMNMQNAEVVGNQLMLASNLNYESIARAAGGGKKAFKDATALLVENMLESSTKRLEISMLYGADPGGLGKTTSSANVDTTHSTITLTDATWASGIWAGSETANLVVYSAPSAAIGGATNLLVSSGVNSVFAIDSVNAINKTLTVSGSTTGITALDIAILAGSCSLYFKGAVSGTGASFAFQEMAGLKKLITNTGSQFGIDAGTWNLWAGNTLTVTGQLTMQKILQGVALCVQRGLNERVVALVNPDAWTDLASNLAALRRFDGSYATKEAKNGWESIKFYGQNGEIEILPYNIVKAGDCIVVPPAKLMRPGAIDLTFGLPGFGDRVFLHLETVGAVQLRMYTEQCIFLATPARAVYISGFTNSADS